MGNVKPFSRDADFWYQRSRVNAKSGHILDALDLMRGAVEREPDNPMYNHELALIYTELNCPSLSNRTLLGLIDSGLFSGESMFMMGGNYLMMGDIRAANSLILRYVTDNPDSLDDPVVQRSVAKVMHGTFGSAYQAITSPSAWYHYMNGELLARRGNYARALAELNQCLARRANNRQALALKAVCLARLGHNKKARATARALLSDAELSAGNISSAALALAVADDPEDALNALSRAMTLDRTASEQELVIDAAIATGDHKFTQRAALDMLTQRPSDMRALHVAAAASIRLGEPFENARPYWARITRLEPNNSVAAYYLASDPNSGTPDYQQRVPEAERLARLEYLSGIPAECAAHEWRSSERFRHMLIWSILSGAGHDSDAVPHQLAAIDAPELTLALREHLMADGVPDEFRRAIITSLAKHGAKGPLFARDERGRLTDIAPRRRT